jgi:hypothetical protein
MEKNECVCVIFSGPKARGRRDRTTEGRQKRCYYLIYRRKTEAIVTRHFSAGIDQIVAVFFGALFHALHQTASEKMTPNLIF